MCVCLYVFGEFLKRNISLIDFQNQIGNMSQIMQEIHNKFNLKNEKINCPFKIIGLLWYSESKRVRVSVQFETYIKLYNSINQLNWWDTTNNKALYKFISE